MPRGPALFQGAAAAIVVRPRRRGEKRFMVRLPFSLLSFGVTDSMVQATAAFREAADSSYE